MGSKITDKIDTSTKPIIMEKFAICAGMTLAGFLLSIGNIMGGLRPLAISLICVSKRKTYLFVGIGALAGYILQGEDLRWAKYIVAVMIALIGSFIIDTIGVHSPIAPCVLSFGAVMISGGIINLRLNADPKQYALLLGEAVLTAGVCYIYYRAINANHRQLRFLALPPMDIACGIASVGTLFLSLGEIHFGTVYPMLLLATTVVLFTLRYAGAKWGASLGAIFGLVIGASNKEWLVLCTIMTISAMVAGLFLQLASVGVAAGYLATATCFAIAIGESIGTSIFVSTVLGVSTFLLAPSVICERIENAFDIPMDVPLENSLRQSLVLKLRFASSAMSAISDSVEQVRERTIKAQRKENESNRQNMTSDEYITREIILEKTNQIRMVAGDQFFSISDMLKDLSKELGEAERFDASLSSRVRRVLEEYEIYPTNVSVLSDKEGRMRVEILTSNEISPSKPQLLEKIGAACNRYFEAGRVSSFKSETLISFFEKPNYSLNIGFAQNSAEGDMCGDTVKIVNDSKGHSILIISDGMGKGSRAALDGAMGAGLLARLINAGFSFDCSLKVVNSALLIKSNDETLATLDVASIDLFTGKCELLKAGAPASYIIKEQGITKCELSSMPAGILRGIEFARRTAVLSPDDKIILMSDGITDLGEQWIKDSIENMPADCQQAADYILAQAMDKMEHKRMDDMSIIIAQLERN